MLVLVRYLLCFLARLFLSLRYRVRVHGLEKIRGLQGPVLVLPNHPGLNDPLLVLAAIWPTLKPRPMVYEGNFTNPFMRLLMKVLNAIKVPALDQASARARQRATQAVEVVIAGLKNGENHILWPSGRIQHDGKERLGGARALADILQAVPNATIVLVRTRGVWGSMFSYAQTGEHPNLIGRYAAGLGWIIANLFLFTPRRQVDITIEPLDRSRLPELRRETLNPWLEAWYNENDGAEKPTYVPYHFAFGRRTFEFPRLQELEEIDVSQVKPEIREAVTHMIADKLGRPLIEDELKPDTTFDQLGLDSLDRMELNLRVEQQYGFTSEQVPTTIGQLWALAQGLVQKGPPKPPPAGWFAGNGTSPGSQELLEILGDTVAEAFVAAAQRGPRDVVAADDLAGAVTYERMLTGALAMSRRFASIPAPNVGLMLPASVACDTAFLALHLAGKLPVVLNWTTGPANLAHAARIMGLTHVVTSRAFIDRTAIEIEGVEYLYLEKLRQDMGKVELLRTLLTVRWLPGHVRNLVPLISPDQPAVVLFTSGSEKAPKAVPLTHRNILTNLRSAIGFFGVYRSDSILGFLPAFHSFGMTVTCLLPLLAGMRVVHHPDPTDASGLARKLGTYRPTLLAGTPTFVNYIFERAEPDQLKSLRLIVVGAEKCPPHVRRRCAELAPSATLLEGYGITECSPVVSANRTQANRPGTLGQPLANVEVLVVDLETDQPLPRNQMGMLLVSGPTIFPGYIAHDGPSPFQERDGKRWYITGDLAFIDDDGFIHFGGRLKRFLKVGGEMVSLPALEEPFANLYPPTKDGPRVAVEGIETESGRRIVLFTTEPINLREANARLVAEGFHGVMRLDEVRQVEYIPVLGTGKTDYKALRALLQQDHHEAHESHEKKAIPAK